MILLKVSLKDGSSASWEVDNFTISEGVLTWWLAKTNEEVALDMDDIDTILALAVPKGDGEALMTGEAN